MNCHECGHENPDAARFCNDCGNRLVRDKQADERKQLTVVFADLVDSTRLAARLDPEDWSDAVKRYQSVCQTCVARYDGHIAQYLGDGVLVYFGYPVTYEDSAARALHCALAMRKGLDAINPELSVDLGIELQMRIGVHTGPVVVGKVGRGAQSETLALGNTPNVAARLQGLAPPDGIAVSQLTLDLAGGGFSGKALGAQNLKGLEKPLETSLLEDYNTATETLAPTFFFGRKTQLAQMQELWLQVVARSAQAAVIVGEPGIGKSSFTRAFRTTLGESEHNWLAIRCSAFESGAPFASLIAGLQRYLALADSMGRAHLGALDERERSSMHDFLVLPPNAELPVIGSQIEKRELFIQGVIELLKLAAEERPLVLCMEDIHWVDPSTLELLYHLTQQTRESAILVLLTARSEPEHPVSPIHRITLGALPAEDIAALISELLGDVDPDEVAALAKRCNGIPLFAEELAK
ncbi:MAG: class 3 adenylate cyclase, partial [Candidatus Azotimanducaceae bacterium]